MLFVALGFVLATSGVVHGDPAMQLEAGNVAVEFVAHACFRLHAADGTRVVIDPFASDVWITYSLPPASELDADVVLISHPHYDHDAGLSMNHEFPWKEARRIRGNQAAEVGEFRIQGIPGRHAKEYGKAFDHENTIWLIEVAGVRLAHLGDNGPLTAANVEALGRGDLLMIPVDGREHILSFGEVDAIVEAVDPRVVVPMHYRMKGLEVKTEQRLDLGNIEEWIERRDDVRVLEKNFAVLTASDLPESREVWVFPYSPKVRRYGDEP